MRESQRQTRWTFRRYRYSSLFESLRKYSPMCISLKIFPRVKLALKKCYSLHFKLFVRSKWAEIEKIHVKNLICFVEAQNHLLGWKDRKGNVFKQFLQIKCCCSGLLYIVHWQSKVCTVLKSLWIFGGSPWIPFFLKVLKFLCKSLKSRRNFFNFEWRGLETVFKAFWLSKSRV